MQDRQCILFRAAPGTGTASGASKLRGGSPTLLVGAACSAHDSASPLEPWRYLLLESEEQQLRA